MLRNPLVEFVFVNGDMHHPSIGSISDWLDIEFTVTSGEWEDLRDEEGKPTLPGA